MPAMSPSSPSVPPRTSPPKRQRPRKLSRLGLLGDAIFLLGALRLHYGLQIPEVPFPHPPLPVPNAFDVFAKAGASLKGVREPRGEHELNKIFAPDASLSGQYTQVDRKLFIRRNAAALQLTRRALHMDYLALPQKSPFIRNTNSDTDRALVRLFVLEGQLRASQGNWSGSVESDLNAVQIGEMVPRGNAITGGFVGTSMQSIGRQDVYAAISHLNAAQARAAAQRLSAIMARHVPFADWVENEKWQVLSTYLDLFHNRLPSDDSEEDDKDYPSSQKRGKKEDSGFVFMIWPRRTVMHSAEAYMDQTVANARLPYIEKRPAPPFPSDIFNRFLLDNWEFGRFLDVNSVAKNSLLLASFALRAYQVEHHGYPKTLSALVPHYLPRLPEDPFSLHKPVQYHRDGASFVLYSIGPDGEDDGGRPIDDLTRVRSYHPEERYAVREDSSGDIVAGINLR